MRSRGLLMVGALCVGVLTSISAVLGPTAASDVARTDRPASQDALASSIASGAIVIVSGEVDVEGGTTPLTVPMLGQVQSVFVKEGDAVKKDQLLFRLDTRLAELEVAQAQAAVEEAALRLDQARTAVNEHAHLVRQQEQSLAVAEARLQAQARQVEQLEKLHKSSAISEENHLAAKDRQRELAAAVVVEKEKLAEVRLANPDRGIRLAQVALEAARTRLEAARENLGRHSLKAPSDGTILRVDIGPGQVLGLDQRRPPIWFCPDADFIVRCEVEQEFVHRISPGMPVEIVPEGAGALRWSGRVRRVAPWVAPKRTIGNPTFDLLETPTVECVVDIDPSPEPLRIGQRVRAALRQAPAADAAPLQAN